MGGKATAKTKPESQALRASDLTVEAYKEDGMPLHMQEGMSLHIKHTKNGLDATLHGKMSKYDGFSYETGEFVDCDGKVLLKYTGTLRDTDQAFGGGMKTSEI